MLPLETQITTDRYLDPNLYTTVVGSRVSLPCNTTPSTGDDQVALLLFYKEDSPPTVQTTSDPSADKDESKNESKEDKFLNHKARPIYSIDAREAPLVLATHFPGDSIDSSRLTIRFEPTQQAANQKQRKKSNRKGNRHHEEGAYASDEGKPSIKPRTSGKGMVYLEISNVKKTDAGVYRCRVDYRRGRTINWMITLSVSVPTTKLDIFDQNSMLDSSKSLVKAGPYNEGSDVNLTCVSDGGLPPPVIRWYHEDDKIAESAIQLPSTRADQTALLLPLTKLASSQLNELYTCKAFANNNQSLTPIPSLTRTITIDLNLKPKDVKIISSVDKVTASRPLELICQVSGFKPTAKLIWVLVHDNSIALDQIDLLETFSLDAFVPTTANLTMKRPENETTGQIDLRSEHKHRFTRLPDLGASQSEDGLTLTGFISYRPAIEDNGHRLACIAFNPSFLAENHYIHDSIVLEVKFSPIVFLAMGASVQHEVILKGYDVFFQCNVQANPSVTDIGWKFNDQPLKSDERLGIQITNTTLLLKNVYSVHSGSYTCFATNSQGTGQSEFIQLNVQYKPFCKQTHRLYVGVSQSESVTINCEMDANPNQDLQYIWTFNGIELPNNQLTSSDQAAMRFEANRSQLIYTPRKPEHFGQFRCISISSLGSSDEEDVCVVNLVPAGVPDVLSNCTQFNLTQQSFTLSCLAGFNGGLEQSYHLELWIKKQEEHSTGHDATSSNEQSNEISPLQNLPTITPKSERSSVLILEKADTPKNVPKPEERSNLSLSEGSTKVEKKETNNLRANNPDVNFSHLLSSINLSNLGNQTGNETNRLPVNSSAVDMDKHLAEKELRKINYGLMRKSSNKLLNMNTLNLNNTETYDRLVRRLKEAKFYLMANLTSFDYPFFSVYSLPVNAEFQLIIYASNSKGRSKELHLSGNTLLASHWQTEKVNETYLPFNPSLILPMTGVIFLVLISSTILFAMKFRAEKNKKTNNKKHDFVNESLENLDLDHLSMDHVNHGHEMVLNSCAHRGKVQPTLNGHVSFADANLLNANLNVCSLNPTIIAQDGEGKSIQTSQLFSSYQLNDTDFNLDQNHHHILRDLYLNQIILPQQDLSKFQETQMDANHLLINEKLGLLSGQPTSNNHCVLLGGIYADKLPDCCNLTGLKSEQNVTDATLAQQSYPNELCASKSSQTNQLEQNTMIPALELSGLRMENGANCQMFIYEDRLI